MSEERRPPVPMDTVDEVLSVAEFFARTRSGTTFTIDKLLEMLSAADDEGRDFAIHIGDRTYLVRRESIREYFTVNPKPKRPMSKEDENRVLRYQIKELEAELARLRSASLSSGKKPESQPEQSTPREEREGDEDQGFDAEPLPVDPEPAESTAAAIREELKRSVEGVEPLRPARFVRRNEGGV